MIFVISLIFTVVFILTLRPHAGRFGLLDYPGDHKVHSEPTPMIGGPAIFVGVTVALFLAAPSDVALKLFMDMSPLLLLGLVDDIWKLRPMSRLIIQVAVVTQMMIVHNTAFVQLGFLVGSSQLLQLNQLSIPFTIFALVGLINAINLSDGLDGLAGGLSAIALAFFGAIAWAMGFPNVLALCLAALGAALGFLIFNIRHPWQQKARVFMGDSGSLLLGLILGILAFKLTHRPMGQANMPPVLALWILAIPLIDTVTVLLRRIAAGRNPLRADQQHLHHIILRAGFSHAKTVWIILAAATGLAGLAVLAWQLGVSDAKLMLAFMFLAIAYFTFSSFFYKRLQPAQDIVAR